MKSFKTYLFENNLFLFLEYKEWHQLVKQFGDKIIDQYKLGYEQPIVDEKDQIRHKTEFIKTKLGLENIPKHHGRWILNQSIKGNIPNQEDIASTIIPNLAKFEEYKDIHRINLSKVNNRTELFNIVQKHAPEELNSHNLKEGKDYTLHGENEHWKVIEPHTEAAACAFSSNTNWCTASKSSSMFNKYAKDGPMQILIPKKPLYVGEKYQYHQASDQFMNHQDVPVNEDYKKQLSLVNRPLPKIDEFLKFNLEFRASITNTKTEEKDLLKLVDHPSFGDDPRHIGHAIESPHESVAMAAVKHPSFGKDPSHIESAMNSPYESVAMAAVQHPRFGKSPGHIEAAMKSPHKYVAMDALGHLSFGSDPSHIESAMNSPHKSVAEETLEHPSFGSDKSHFREALRSKHESVAIGVLYHPSFGSHENHLMDALRSKRESVARAAVAHPSFGSNPRYFNAAIHSDYESVAKDAVAHPSFDIYPVNFDRALRSKHESVVNLVKEKINK